MASRHETAATQLPILTRREKDVQNNANLYFFLNSYSPLGKSEWHENPNIIGSYFKQSAEVEIPSDLFSQLATPLSALRWTSLDINRRAYGQSRYRLFMAELTYRDNIAWIDNALVTVGLSWRTDTPEGRLDPLYAQITRIIKDNQGVDRIVAATHDLSAEGKPLVALNISLRKNENWLFEYPERNLIDIPTDQNSLSKTAGLITNAMIDEVSDKGYPYYTANQALTLRSYTDENEHCVSWPIFGQEDTFDIKQKDGIVTVSFTGDRVYSDFQPWEISVIDSLKKA